MTDQVVMFEVTEYDARNGRNFQVVNRISNKIVCQTWTNEQNARTICEALNLYNDLLRVQLLDKVVQKVQEIRNYNEQPK